MAGTQGVDPAALAAMSRLMQVRRLAYLIIRTCACRLPGAESWSHLHD